MSKNKAFTVWAEEQLRCVQADGNGNKRYWYTVGNKAYLINHTENLTLQEFIAAIRCIACGDYSI